MTDTVAITISRSYPIKQCLEAIDQADIPDGLNLFILLDTKDRDLIDYCKNYRWKHRWEGKEIISNKQDPVDPKKVEDYQEKWDRIIENIRLVRDWTEKSEIVFMVEDDTIIPKDAFQKLYNKIKEDKSIGCIQGVEVIRAGIENCCCGAWKLYVRKCGRIGYKIGLKAKRKGIEHIDGGGYYCWAFRQEAIQQITFRAELENGWCGPDVWTWYDLGQRGWKTLIDWSVWCGHIEKDGKIYTPKNTRNWLYDFSNGDHLHPKMDYDYKM